MCYVYCFVCYNEIALIKESKRSLFVMVDSLESLMYLLCFVHLLLYNSWILMMLRLVSFKKLWFNLVHHTTLIKLTRIFVVRTAVNICMHIRQVCIIVLAVALKTRSQEITRHSLRYCAVVFCGVHNTVQVWTVYTGQRPGHDVQLSEIVGCCICVTEVFYCELCYIVIV